MAVTVEEYIPKNSERQYFTMTSDKFKSTYSVRPTKDGFVFFEIVCDKGHLAPELSGMYLSPKQAIEAFELWERKQAKSEMKKREENRIAREEQKIRQQEQEETE